MRTTENLKVIVSNFDSDVMYIIDSRDIEKTNVHDCYDDAGQRIDEESAGDYSLFNTYCDDIFSNMVEAGEKKFGTAFRDMKLDYSDLTIINSEEIGLSDKEKEINEFIQKYEDENASYTECEAINFWDGRNYRSIIIGDETVCGEYHYADDELAEKILKEYSQIESPDFREGFGLSKIESGEFVFGFSQYQNDNFNICSVRRVEDCDL